MFAYIHVNKLIKGSHCGTKYGSIQKYLEIELPGSIQKYPDQIRTVIHVSIFAMTAWPKQLHVSQLKLTHSICKCSHIIHVLSHKSVYVASSYITN